MGRGHRFILVGLILAFVIVLLAGSAVQPATVRSDDVGIQTTCWCYYNIGLQQWCYKCCAANGCFDLYCSSSGC